MKITRKQFLCTGAGLTLSGCTLDLRPGIHGPAPDAEPVATPSLPTVDWASHLQDRLSFGPRGGEYGRILSLGGAAYIDEQLHPETIDDSALNRSIRRIECIHEPLGELFEYKQDYLLAAATRATILRAVWSKRQLLERMVHFWTDHFNIDASKGDCKWLKVADDRDVIRKNALGSFPALLRASALSPAMLWYLDGRVNRKQQSNDKPNENYARELLELHTVGVHGGYTQQDVMETARCLTGWNVRSGKELRKGRVEFHAELHDDGRKVVLGHEIPAGLGDGEIDFLLDILSLHPSTARHIAEKLCRRFIADEPPESAVAIIAATFVEHKGEIKPVLRRLFTMPEFLGAQRTKCKRPFEFLVSALRATNAETDGGPGLTDYLLRMGHAPFQYPTPEGYSDHAAPWMGTLLWRWRFAMALSSNAIPGTRIDLAPFRDDRLIAHVLGRVPTSGEFASYRRSGNNLALLLASPEFQRC